MIVFGMNLPVVEIVLILQLIIIIQLIRMR